MRFFFRLSLIVGLVACAGAVWAADAKETKGAKETNRAANDPAPATLPGAEAHILREPLPTPAGTPEPLRVHVFKPRDWKNSDRRPAWVWFFGGGWTGGTPGNAAGWARWAAGHGFVGVAPDYRTKNRFGTSPLESVADARAAVRWVQTHASELGIDPNRVVVGGNSAGGHVALWTALAKTPPGSDAAEAPLTKPAALVLTSAVSDTSVEKGYTPARFGANALALSPIDQLERAMPPVILFHGDADKTVPQAQSIALHEKLQAAGVPCEFVSVPGGSHNYAGDLPEWRAKTFALTEAFLRAQKVWPGEAAR